MIYSRAQKIGPAHQALLLAVLVAALATAFAGVPVRAQQSDVLRHYEDAYSLAARDGDLALVRQYIARGASPDRVDSDGRTPLINATIGGHVEIAEAVLATKPKIDIRDKIGNSALIWAVISDQYEIAELMLEAGANVDVQNRQGLTPLMLAAKQGVIDIVEMLLANNAHPNIRDYTGRAALGWARESRNRRATKILIQAGAID
ncbi:MAG: ankyrin repeat domain-containing protein [Alphaproteobacteria bacterium]|nr:ankyrin repeat domain-containing protein [Alphaproteobacteria bacterium]